MHSACSSPKSIKRTLVLNSPTANSQRTLLIETTSPKSAVTKKNPLFHILPSTSTPQGRAKLFKELASPQHKQSDSHLSFKSLSNSIADVRKLANMRESTESGVLSPKSMKPTRLHTMSGQDFFVRGTEITEGEQSPTLEKKNNTEMGSTGELTIQLGTSPKSNLAKKRGLSLANASTLAFREEMRKDYEGSPLIKVDEEALYYDTIKNLDVCGRCWTNCQKHYTTPFKIKPKDNRSSSYQRDYVAHPLAEKSPTVTAEHYDAYHSNHTVSLGTTMRGDYKPWASNYVRHEGLKPTLGPDGSAMLGKSSYNFDFPGYKTPKGPVERNAQPLTTLKDLPFVGNSSYRQTYTESEEPRQFVTRWPKKGGKSPVLKGVPFLGQTTNSFTYRPFKVEGGHGKGNNRDGYQPTQAFMNQYMSTYTKDYEAKGEMPCPARVFIDNNPHPRMKHLKA